MEKTENLIKALKERFEKSYDIVVLTESDTDYVITVEIAFIKKCSNWVSFVCQIRKYNNFVAEEDKCYQLVKLIPVNDSGFITYYEIDEVAKSVR